MANPEASLALLLVVAIGWAMRERMRVSETRDTLEACRAELFRAWEKLGETQRKLTAAEEANEQRVAAELS